KTTKSFPKRRSSDLGEKRVVTKLKVDGYRGKATIKRWQQFLGTTQDGKISKTSHAIKKWQQFLNKYDGAKLKEDGKEGKATIKATQKFKNRSEEHTSELQSRFDLVCRLLLE